MPRYRRNYIPGGSYFFTVVTYRRRPILVSPLGRRQLRLAIENVRHIMPFEVVAMVLLPDHLHTVWSLPDGDVNYSLRWRRIKEQFTRGFLEAGGLEAALSASRVKHRERGIWQRRFWEHTCRDEDDLKRCVDYVHWNPKKHTIVRSIRDYPWSTFHKFVKRGEYPANWGRDDPCAGYNAPEWE